MLMHIHLFMLIHVPFVSEINLFMDFIFLN